MPSLTVTREVFEALGVTMSDLREPTLAGHARSVLEPLLASRGFDIAREITFTVLADDSIVLTQ
jgi:hypothetical protein